VKGVSLHWYLFSSLEVETEPDHSSVRASPRRLVESSDDNRYDLVPESEVAEGEEIEPAEIKHTHTMETEGRPEVMEVTLRLELWARLAIVWEWVTEPQFVAL
jgi:hypothetical protein